MTRIISIESVRRGNAAMSDRRHNGVSMNGDSVVVRRVLDSRTYSVVLSKKKIEEEARKAFSKISK